MVAYVEPESLPVPGPIGRGVRLIAGVVTGWIAIDWGGTLASLLRTLQPDSADPIELLVVLCVTVYLIAFVPMAFGGRWRYARETAVALVVGLGVVSLAIGDRFLGIAVVLPAYAVGLAAIALLSVSFLVSAAFAAPG